MITEKKQIIIDYDEYLYLLEQIKQMKELIAGIYFSPKEKISENKRNSINNLNNIYGWWL